MPANAPTLTLFSVTPSSPGYAVLQFQYTIDTTMQEPFFSILDSDLEDVLNNAIAIEKNERGAGDIFTPPLPVPATYTFEIYGLLKADPAMDPLTLDVKLFDAPVITSTFNGNNVCRVTFSKVEGDFIIFKVRIPNSKSVSSVELNVLGATLDVSGNKIGDRISENVYEFTLANLPLLDGRPQSYKLRASFKSLGENGPLSNKFYVSPSENFDAVVATIDLCDSDGNALPLVAGKVQNVLPTGFKLTWQEPANLVMHQNTPHYLIFELTETGDYVLVKRLDEQSCSLTTTKKTGSNGSFQFGEVYKFMVAACVIAPVSDDDVAAMAMLMAQDAIPNSVVQAKFYGLPAELTVHAIAGDSVIYWSGEPTSFGSYTPVINSHTNSAVTVNGADYGVNFSHQIYDSSTDAVVTSNIGNYARATDSAFQINYFLQKDVYAEISDDQNGAQINPHPAMSSVLVYYSYLKTDLFIPANQFTVSETYHRIVVNNEYTSFDGFVPLSPLDSSCNVVVSFTPTPAPTNTFLWAEMFWDESSSRHLSSGDQNLAQVGKDGSVSITLPEVGVGAHEFYMIAYFKDEQNIVTTVQTNPQTVTVVKMADAPNVSVDFENDANDVTMQTIVFKITKGLLNNPVNNNDLYYGVSYLVLNSDGVTAAVYPDGTSIAETERIKDSSDNTVFSSDSGAEFRINIPVFDQRKVLSYKVWNYYSETSHYPPGVDVESMVSSSQVITNEGTPPSNDNTDATNFEVVLLPTTGNQVTAYASFSWLNQQPPLHTIVSSQVLTFTSGDVSYSKVLGANVNSTSLTYEDFHVVTQGNLDDAAAFLSGSISVSRTLNFTYPSGATVEQQLAAALVLVPVFPTSGFTALRDNGNSLRVDIALQAYAGLDYSLVHLFPNMSCVVDGTDLGSLWDFKGGSSYPLISAPRDLTISAVNKRVVVSSTQTLSLVNNSMVSSAFSKSEPDQFVVLYNSILPVDTSGIEINYTADQVTTLTFVVSPPVNAFSNFFLGELADPSGSTLFKQQLSVNGGVVTPGSVLTPWKGLQSGQASVNYKITTTDSSFSPLAYDLSLSDDSLITYPSNSMSAPIVVVVPIEQTIDNGTPVVNFLADQIDSVTWTSPPVSFEGYIVSLFDDKGLLQYQVTDDGVVLKSCIGVLTQGVKNWFYQVSHKKLVHNVPAIDLDFYQTSMLNVSFNVPVTETIENAAITIEVTPHDSTQGVVRTLYDTVAAHVTGLVSANGLSYLITFSENDAAVFFVDKNNVQKMGTSFGVANTEQNLLAAGPHIWSASIQRFDASSNPVGDAFIVNKITFDISHSQRMVDAAVTLTHSADNISSVSVVAPNYFQTHCDLLSVLYESVPLVTISTAGVVTNTSAGLLKAGVYDSFALHSEMTRWPSLTFACVKPGVSFDNTSYFCNTDPANPFIVSASETIEGANLSISVGTHFEPAAETDFGNVHIYNDVVTASVSGVVVAEGLSYLITFKEDGAPIFFVDQDNVQKMGDSLDRAATQQDLLSAGTHSWTASIQRFSNGVPVGSTYVSNVPDFEIRNSQQLQDMSVKLFHSADQISYVSIFAPIAFLTECDELVVKMPCSGTALLTISNAAEVTNNTSEGLLSAGTHTLYFQPQKNGNSVGGLLTDQLEVLAAQTIDAAAGMAVTYAYNHVSAISFDTPPNTPSGYQVLLLDEEQTALVVFDSDDLSSPLAPRAFSNPPKNQNDLAKIAQLSARNHLCTYQIQRKKLDSNGRPVGRGLGFDVNAPLTVAINAYEVLRVGQGDIGLYATARVPAGDVLDLSGCVTFTVGSDVYTNDAQIAATEQDNTYAQVSKVVYDADFGTITLLLATNLNGLASVDYTVGLTIANVPQGKAKGWELLHDTSGISKPLTINTPIFSVPVLNTDYRSVVSVSVDLTDTSGVARDPADVKLRLTNSSATVPEATMGKAIKTWTFSHLPPGNYDYTVTSKPIHEYQNYGVFSRTGTFHVAIAPYILAPNLVPPLVTKNLSGGSSLAVTVNPNNAKPSESGMPAIFVVAISTPKLPTPDALAQAIKTGQCILVDGQYVATFEYDFVVDSAILIASTDIGVTVALLNSDGSLSYRGGASLVTGTTPVLASFVGSTAINVTSATDLNTLSPTDFSNISLETFSALQPYQLASLKATQAANITALQLQSLSNQQLASIRLSSQVLFSSKTVALLTLDQKAALASAPA